MGRNDRQPPGGAKKQAGFNQPFKQLKVQKQQAKEAESAAPARPKPSPPKRPGPERSDDELFLQAMAGIARFSEDPRGSAPPPPPRPPQIVDDDAEALAQLSELVSGEGPFDIADTDEYIEGAAPGIDKRLVLGLRRGDYAVQGHLDLHGMTKADAKQAVERFLAASRIAGKRCVLIVHGRGLNSKDQIPVLKERLRVWLQQQGRIGRSVLAFATARPHDGGAGAVYVLLRR